MKPNPQDSNIWNTTHDRIKAADQAAEITGMLMQENPDRFRDEDEAIEHYRELREEIFWEMR